MSDNKKMAAKAYEENKKMLSLADKALAKAKKIEKQKMKKGWKYVQVGDYTQILVPCDEKANLHLKHKQKLRVLRPPIGNTNTFFLFSLAYSKRCTTFAKEFLTFKSYDTI